LPVYTTVPSSGAPEPTPLKMQRICAATTPRASQPALGGARKNDRHRRMSLRRE
jgi:hypothetical protein